MATIATLSCLILVGVGRTAAVGHGPGVYPADRSLTPEGVVRAYVLAINERDGTRFCGLVASWISGRIDLYGNDPDAQLLRPLDCPEFVHGFIGYIEDCCPPKFVRAEITGLGPRQAMGGLIRIDAALRVHVDKDGEPAVVPLRDVVWLVRDRGAWRIAKLGAVAAEASLASETAAGLRAKPDVAAERRRFAADVAAFESRLREREASYRRVAATHVCRASTVTVRDPVGDVRDWILPAPRTPLPRVGRADLVTVSITSRQGTVCVEFQTTGRVHGPAELSFGLTERRRGGYYNQRFEIELRLDGRGRVTSGLDAERRPKAVPAKVGVLGDRLTLLVDQRSFASGTPGVGSVGRPSLRRFSFSASVNVRLSVRRETHDPLGNEPNGTFFVYPSGQPCQNVC